MHLLSALALAGLASAAPTVVNDANALLKLRQTRTLNAAMVAAGREYVGTSLTIRNDNSESTLIRNEFGSITPENAMKWDATEPRQGQFSLGGADQIATTPGRTASTSGATPSSGTASCRSGSTTSTTTRR